MAEVATRVTEGIWRVLLCLALAALAASASLAILADDLNFLVMLEGYNMWWLEGGVGDRCLLLKGKVRAVAGYRNVNVE